MMIVFALNCRRGLLRESNGLERFAENHLTAGIASAVHTPTRRAEHLPAVFNQAERGGVRPEQATSTRTA